MPTHDLRQSFRFSATWVVVLWVITLGDYLLGLDLYRFGIYPRRMDALPGILLAPLVHASFGHLFSNTLPLLVLGTALVYGYPRASRIALPVIYIGSGICVWLLGRPSFHVGASGLALGIMVFVFLMGAVRWDRRAIALSCLVFFLYGGMIWGVFPGTPGMSFEYHLSGAALGIVCVWWLRNLDPPPPPKRYDWEDEDDPV